MKFSKKAWHHHHVPSLWFLLFVRNFVVTLFARFGMIHLNIGTALFSWHLTNQTQYSMIDWYLRFEVYTRSANIYVEGKYRGPMDLYPMIFIRKQLLTWKRRAFVAYQFWAHGVKLVLTVKIIFVLAEFTY